MMHSEIEDAGGGLVLLLDEPQAVPRRRGSGPIRVKGRGRRLLPSDVLEAEVPQLATFRTRVGEVSDCTTRDLDRLIRFQFPFHTSGLQSGRHALVLRLIRGERTLKTLETAILVDHDFGYSSDYERWIAEIERPAEVASLESGSSSNAETIGVALWAEQGNLLNIDISVESVTGQRCGNWNLHLFSTNPDNSAELRNRYKEEARITVIDLDVRPADVNTELITSYLPKNGYTCFLRAGDRLDTHALSHTLREIQKHERADLLYCDHDYIDEENERSDPFLKPDWSPDLLLSFNYIADVLAVRNRILRTTGALPFPRSDIDSYSLLLGLTAKCQQIRHIPSVLYHKRKRDGEQQIEDDSAIKEAIKNHCAKRGERVEVETGAVEGTWRVRYPHVETPVSILVASGGRIDLLRENIASLTSLTRYSRYEILIIDNSRTGRVKQFVHSLQAQSQQPKIRYFDWRERPFNYPELNNAAARECSSELLLFLNDDTSVIDPDWLTNMVELAVRPEVGVVGAKLLYPNGRIQHAGIVVGLQGAAAHVFRGMNDTRKQYGHYPDVIRNVSAVTGACLMTRASIFWQAGGFDADKFPIDFNDVDLCLKIASKGYRVLYTPFAKLYHHESLSRRDAYLKPDFVYVTEFKSRWPQAIANDPYYNPNLTDTDEDYSLRTLTRHADASQVSGAFAEIPWTTLLRLVEGLKRVPRSEPPMFSIITPVHNAKVSQFVETALSVLSQTNPNWEWCIVDDCSSERSFHKLFPDLKELPHIKMVKLQQERGISKATNTGLNLSEGRFACFLNSGDMLEPSALSKLADALKNGADAAYSDSDRIDGSGRSIEIFCKQDWRPEFFRSTIHVGHLLCVRRELALRVGGFDGQLNRAQDFEFFLRFNEHTQRIVHVPEVLYHWRTDAGNTARDWVNI
jgi:GT2 family glycosyltransferase